MTNQTRKQRISEKKTARENRENEILNKVLGIFVVGALAEIYALLCYRFFVQSGTDTMLAWLAAIRWTSYITAAVAVVGLILAFAKKTSRRLRYLGVLLAWLGIVFAFASRVILLIYPQGTTIMCALIPVITLYGFIYYLYQREFFVSALAAGISIGALWLCHKAIGDSWQPFSVGVAAAVLVVLALIAALTLSLSKNDGCRGRDEKKRRVFSAKTNYAVQYGALAVCAATVAIAIANAAAAMYLIWAVVILLFVLAVYHTVRLM
jgi:hypothetical protein